MRRDGKTPILGQSRAMETLRAMLRAIASSASTALISGESGTGKELIAQALHDQSPRAHGPFVPLNCGAIPRELIESELFGHRKGAFTGAVTNRVGRIELANGGTLFLDEIGDLPLDMQVKLLRVLQERRILPVGAPSEEAVDVRIVAATHKDLEEEVRAGRFREDLYYRINVLPIFATALRERTEDIPELLEFYADRHALPGQPAIDFDADVVRLMQTYHWPGNVRELSNLVDRFSTLFPGRVLGLADLPSCMLPSGMAGLQARLLSEQQRPDVVPLALASGHELARLGPIVPAVLWPLNDMSPLQEQGEAVVPDEARLTPAPPAPAVDEAPAGGFHAVEEAILMAQGIDALPPEGLSLKEHLTVIERSLIAQALARTQGNVSQTARLLKIQRTTLIEKINKYELRAAG